jgi:hypothetical protein
VPEDNSVDNLILSFDSPARYSIRALGRIKESWCDRLEGMTITQETQKEKPIYTLEGELQDQAALNGVLNTLYELHQTVLLVKCLASTLTKE